jgi:CheY-like chemotaxis protein
MNPTVLVLEPQREVADALRELLTSVRYATVVRPHLERLGDLGVTPAAIIVRIAFEGLGEPAHAAISRLPPGRPPVIAIASDEHEVNEARRLGCDVVLRAPAEVNRLCEVLSQVINT